MCSGDPDVGECPLGKVDVSGDVLANDGLGVVAGHVVPLDAVTIKVVEDGQASLVRALLAAVGLGPPSTAVKVDDEFRSGVVTIKF